MTKSIAVSGPGPVVMLDDCAEDLMIAKLCLDASKLDNPFVGIEVPSELLDYLQRVLDGRESMPALVLLDISMPEMSGFEVLSRIRERPEFNAIPVIVMLTNSDNPADRSKALGLGADGFKTKESDIQALTSFFDGLAA